MNVPSSLEGSLGPSTSGGGVLPYGRCASNGELEAPYRFSTRGDGTHSLYSG